MFNWFLLAWVIEAENATVFVGRYLVAQRHLRRRGVGENCEMTALCSVCCALAYDTSCCSEAITW